MVNLQELLLYSNELIAIDPALWSLQKLRVLGLSGNKLLHVLPRDVANLVNLEELRVSGCGLPNLPPEVGKLTSLKQLRASGNALSVLPPELGDLVRLERLTLDRNGLRTLPPEIGRLCNLRILGLSGNKLRELPAEIGGLTMLTKLDLGSNELSSLPIEIGKLHKLTKLNLSEGRGKLNSLPAELGDCTELHTLEISNPASFRFPPADVVELGGLATLRYLRAARVGATEVWESKLLVVGEGAVGKTWLYEALNGRVEGGNRYGDGATVGIEIGLLDLRHPNDPAVTMRLNCWDFAGQDINHATHQFFFSQRTLFVLCWNARAGWEAGKLRKWLTNIRDRAPGASVILVATHSDQPHSDYPEKELRAEFDQIVSTFKVSSKTGDGIEDLKMEIALRAQALPMMGLRWPKKWRAAEEAVKALHTAGPYTSLLQVLAAISSCGLQKEDADVLLRWLHELGEILHYADVPELADLVVLDPQWVTRRVGEVLANIDVQNSKGILTQTALEKIWPALDGHVRHYLLGIMEKFDLAYRIPDDQAHRCLVVERLPQNPPEYEARWATAAGQPEVRLRYHLRAMHPGIPTWFIARCHRFTLGLHWLRGVLFGDNRHEPRHLALVTTNEPERTVDFAVRGPQPWTFLPLLTDGFEDTILKRYPGLEFERIAPCPGHRKDGSRCGYEFSIGDLEALRWPQEQGIKPEARIRCTRCRTGLEIEELLLGLSRTAGRDAHQLEDILNAVHSEGQMTREHMTKEMEEARQFIQLSYVQEWNKAQELEEQSCPTVFAMYPLSGKTLTHGSKLRLQLYCMNPHCWHSIGSEGRCEFQPMRDGLVTAVRWMRNGLKWLRPVATLLPSGSALAGEYSEELHDFAEHAANELKFTADVFKEAAGLPAPAGGGEENFEFDSRAKRHNEGGNLRELKAFLDRLKFPTMPYGGLQRVRTPEGHILWLCAKHAPDFAKSTRTPVLIDKRESLSARPSKPEN